jgi:hypothetical protein
MIPGERHNGRHEATPGDRLELIWEQEAPGSNPGIPTISAVQRLVMDWRMALKIV